jgi:hypothetical protein
LTCKFNFRGVSLKNKTYSDLEELSTKLEPGEKLSQAKTVERLVAYFKSIITLEEINYGQSNKEPYQDKK